jgi:hypothetical protein
MIKTIMQPIKPHEHRVAVADLSGDMLDWAAAKALGMPLYKTKRGEWMTAPYGSFNHRIGIPYWRPTTDWAQGGPIIEREKIDVWYQVGVCMIARINGKHEQIGKTQLQAAMRCLVDSKLGAHIDVTEYVTEDMK